MSNDAARAGRVAEAMRSSSGGTPTPTSAALVSPSATPQPAAGAHTQLTLDITGSARRGLYISRQGIFLFQQKPGLTSALACSCLCVTLFAIATFTPWTVFTYGYAAANQSGVGTGSITLTECQNCVSIPFATANINRVVCEAVQLGDIATAMSWMQQTSAAALALLILAIPVQVLATHLTYLHRFDALERLRWTFLSRPLVAAALHAMTAALLFIAFVQYSAMTAGSFNDPLFRTIFQIPPLGTNMTSYTRNYGGGFGITIVACMLAAASSVLTLMFSHEAARTVAPPLQQPEELAVSVASAYQAQNTAGYTGAYVEESPSGKSSAAAAATSTAAAAAATGRINPFRRALSWARPPPDAPPTSSSSSSAAANTPAWGVPPSAGGQGGQVAQQQQQQQQLPPALPPRQLRVTVAPPMVTVYESSATGLPPQHEQQQQHVVDTAYDHSTI